MIYLKKMEVNYFKQFYFDYDDLQIEIAFYPSPLPMPRALWAFF